MPNNKCIVCDRLMTGTMDISDNRRPDLDPNTRHPKMDFEEKRRNRVPSDAVPVRTWSFKKSYPFRFDLNNTPFCTFCGEEGTAEHVVCWCQRWIREREDCRGVAGTLTVDNIVDK